MNQPMNRREFLGHSVGAAGAVTLAALLAQAQPARAATINWQNQWRWCKYCEGLFFYGNPTNGVCPAGRDHTSVGSGDYYIVRNSPSYPGQNQWRWCKNCEGLFFYGNPTNGVCPAGGEHTSVGSSDYYLIQNNPRAIGQSQWRWCKNCEGLFFYGHSDNGVCPAGGEHSAYGSGDYTVYQAAPGIVYIDAGAGIDAGGKFLL